MTPARILLGTDLSSRCDRAFERAVLLARGWNAELVIAHAIETPAPVNDAPSWRRGLDPRELVARRIREDLGESPPVPFEIVVTRGEPAQLVLDAAARRDCGLIVTGVARDEVLGRTKLGATVEQLARQAPVPVLIVQARARRPYRHVVVATDFSDTSRRALVTALAAFPGAAVTLFHAFYVAYESHVPDKMAARDGAERQARAETEAFLAGVPEAKGRDVRVLCEYGPPDVVLRELVDTGRADLVAIGASGRGRIAEFLIGSTANTLLTELPGDILVVPRAR